MVPVLTDLCPRAVAAAMEANLCELGRELARSPPAELHEAPGILTYRTGLAHPLLNGVLRADLKIEEAERRIVETLAPFQAAGLPLRWVIGPSSQPADLGARLLARGFVQEDRPGTQTEHVGMAVDLQAFNDTLPQLAGLTIQPVEGEAGCRAWAAAARRGFELSPEVAEGWADLLGSLPLHPSLRHWVGWYDAQPAATVSLLLAGGVAGIYYLSTAPEARRRPGTPSALPPSLRGRGTRPASPGTRGLAALGAERGPGGGTAMVVEALRTARAAGYRVGVLIAAPPEAGLYRRIGFTEQCLFGIYDWLGDGAPSPRLLTRHPKDEEHEPVGS